MLRFLRIEQLGEKIGQTEEVEVIIDNDNRGPASGRCLEKGLQVPGKT